MLSFLTENFHQGKPVCCIMFQFFHGIGVKRIKNLTKSLKENGLTPRVHGNTNKKPKHAISFLSTEYVVRFLYSFAEQHALLLPGRIILHCKLGTAPFAASTTSRYELRNKLFLSSISVKAGDSDFTSSDA